MAGVLVAIVAVSALCAAGPGVLDGFARSTVLPNQAVSVEPQPAGDADDANSLDVVPATVDVVAEGVQSATGPEPTRVVPVQESLPLGVGTTSRPADGPGRAAEGWWSSGAMQAVGSTVAVVVLIFGVRWVVVRSARSPVGSASVRSQLGPGGRAPSGLLFVLGRYPVSRGASLVLIQLDRRVLLLSQSGAGFQTLAEVTEAEEVASIIGKARDEEGESLSARFTSLLRTFDRRHAESEGAEELRSVVRGGPGMAARDGVAAEMGAVGVEDTPEAIRDRVSALRALVS